jgi:hypothetical protein
VLTSKKPIANVGRASVLIIARDIRVNATGGRITCVDGAVVLVIAESGRKRVLETSSDFVTSSGGALVRGEGDGISSKAVYLSPRAGAGGCAVRDGANIIVLASSHVR